jgi:hypothetical protein
MMNMMLVLLTRMGVAKLHEVFLYWWIAKLDDGGYDSRLLTLAHVAIGDNQNGCLATTHVKLLVELSCSSVSY